MGDRCTLGGGKAQSDQSEIVLPLGLQENPSMKYVHWSSYKQKILDVLCVLGFHIGDQPWHVIEVSPILPNLLLVSHFAFFQRFVWDMGL